MDATPKRIRTLMKNSSTLKEQLSFTGFVAIVVLANVAACGGDKPPPVTPQAKKEPTTTTAAATPPPPTPNTPSAAGVHISPEIVKACGISEADAYFAFDSANVRAEDARVLDLVATCFTTGPLKGRGLSLVGHADPRGASEYNMTLGQSRADGVGTYLVKKGVEKDKVQSTSRGAMDATGTDEAGWGKDRRVDLLLAP